MAPKLGVSELRDGCSRVELRAHAVLDAVRSGAVVSLSVIRWAFRVLGDV